MNRLQTFIVALLIPIFSFSQTRNSDSWIDFGGSHYSKYLQIATAKMGPNALPVPDMDYASIDNESKIGLGAHYHQMPGDTAINSYFNFYWTVAPGRAVVQIWGQPSETFHVTNAVRDTRQITFDDKGWKTEFGDIWISTYIQVFKEQKYIPGLVLNYTCKTTTGSNHNGRYTDANLNYFYLALGKSFNFGKGFLDEIRVAGLFGFYVWQTNKVEMSQDEGPVIEGGIQIRKDTWNWYTEFGGYKGYDAYEFILKKMGIGNVPGYNDPLVLRNRIEKTCKNFNFTLEYQTGFRDYLYQTLKLGVVYHFKAGKF